MERIEEFWKRLRPFAMQDLAVIANKAKAIASSSNAMSILLISSLDGKVIEYTPDEAGLTAAIASCHYDSAILLPPITIFITQQIQLSYPTIIIGKAGFLTDGAYTGSAISDDSNFNGTDVIIDTSGVPLVLDRVAINNIHPRTDDKIGIHASCHTFIHNCSIHVSNVTGGNAAGIISVNTGYNNDIIIKSSQINADGELLADGLRITSSNNLENYHLQDSKFSGFAYAASSSGYGTRLWQFGSTPTFHAMNCVFKGSTHGFVHMSGGGG